MAVCPLSDGTVRLQEWSIADADWYAATAAHDETIQRFTSEPADLTTEQVRVAIRGLAGRADAVGFVICDANTAERLGNIGLAVADGVGDISYWLAARARGRGAATRALHLLSHWAFDCLALNELRLRTHVDNTASRRVAERAGYLRHRELDQRRQVKADTWETVAYRLPHPPHPAP